MRVLCPSCDSELDPNAEACPLCFRKRTRQEIFAGLRGEGSPRLEKKRGGLFGALLWGTLGASLVLYGIRRKMEVPPPTPTTHWLDATLPPPTTASAPQTAPDGSAPAAMGRAASAPPPADAPPGRPASDHWQVSGRVFDLLDLKPAAGADLTFTDASSGNTFRLIADRQGGYKARLPKTGDAGYQVAVRAKGYRRDYLEDPEPSFLLRSADERREAARMLDESKVLHVPVSPARDQEALTLNFALVPSRRRD